MDNTNNEKTEEPKKTEDLQTQLESEKQRSGNFLTRLKYLQADFENLRNRCDRQIQQVSQYSNERLTIQLLEVVDELELAVKTAQAATNPNQTQTLTEGVQMTLKRLRKVLEQEGVTPIESINTPFDPSKHNAISAEEREDVENCVVIEEVRKGYMMKEKVIRPSVVKVAMKKNSESQNKEKDQNESS
jgi:molecular chaperone GrpE